MLIKFCGFPKRFSEQKSDLGITSLRVSVSVPMNLNEVSSLLNFPQVRCISDKFIMTSQQRGYISIFPGTLNMNF